MKGGRKLQFCSSLEGNRGEFSVICNIQIEKIKFLKRSCDKLRFDRCLFSFVLGLLYLVYSKLYLVRCYIYNLSDQLLICYFKYFSVLVLLLKRQCLYSLLYLFPRYSLKNEGNGKQHVTFHTLLIDLLIWR